MKFKSSVVMGCLVLSDFQCPNMTPRTSQPGETRLVPHTHLAFAGMSYYYIVITGCYTTPGGAEGMIVDITIPSWM